MIFLTSQLFSSRISLYEGTQGLRRLKTGDLSHKTKESLLALAWREIALLRMILSARCAVVLHEP